jgi:hypothetical protein
VNGVSTVLVQRKGASNAGPFPLHSQPRSKKSVD